jgi:hypothetical protein
VFLAADSDGVLEELRMQTQDRDLDQALTEIEYAALSKRDKLLYQARMDAIRDEQSVKIDNMRAVAEARAEERSQVGARMLLEMAQARFGALPEPLVGEIGRLSPEQHIEAVRLAMESSDAKAFESALKKLKTQG